MNDLPRGGGEYNLYNNFLLRAEGNFLRASKMAEIECAPVRVQRALHTRAAMTAHDTTDSGALLDTDPMKGAWLDAQAPFAAGERIIADGKYAAGSTRYPVRIGTVLPQAGTTAEGGMKPAAQAEFNSEMLPQTKSTAFVVVAKPLNTLQRAMAQIHRAGRIAIGAAMDRDLFGILTAAGVLTTASSGSTPAAVQADVGAMLAQMEIGPGFAPYLLAPAAVMARIAVMNVGGLPAFDMTPTGGTICGIPVIGCEGGASGSPDDSVLLVDASGIVIDPGTIDTTAGEHASILMDDAPGAGAASLTSMFQTNSIALRYERVFGAMRARTTAVVQLTGVLW